VAVAALRPHSSTAASNPAGFTQGQLPGGQLPNGQLPGQLQGQGGFAGGRGGVDGEERLSGTVTAVGTSTVTIRTPSGTSKYAVTSHTEIVRNGANAALSA